MIDLNLEGILDKPAETYTRVSAYLGGVWQFVALTNPVKKANNQSFYRIDYKFGIVKTKQSDPAKITFAGNPGDYVALDTVGNYSLITKDQYQQMFSPKNSKSNAGPVSSAKLKNPNYITEIVKGSGPTASNSTTVQTTQKKAGKSNGGSTCTNCGGY
jgi:hypothetical protein